MSHPNLLDHELLRDGYTPGEAVLLQAKWRDQLQAEKSESNRIVISEASSNLVVAGVDVAYQDAGCPTWGVGCAVAWSIQTVTELSATPAARKLSIAYSAGTVSFPYIPGLLGFREAWLMVEAILALPSRPDLVMCDGHGYAHPRRFGEAVHVGVVLDLPSMGVAKTPFFGEGDWKDLSRIKRAKVGLYDRGRSPAGGEVGELVGYAACLADGTKPVFVSAGYQATLDSAFNIACLTTLTHRQPEPLNLADRYARAEIASQ